VPPTSRPRPVLTSGELNRATLARQHLLRPADLGVVAAIEALAGLQAQEAASPYLALWTRLRSFATADLDAAFMDRSVVKARLMRVTLHAVSAGDFRAFLPAVEPMLRALRRSALDQVDGRERLERVVASAVAFAAEPRTNVELRDHIVAEAGLHGLRLENAWWWVRRWHPFLHVPTTRPWAFSRRPTLSAAGAWLAEGPFVADAPAVEHLVRRYLGAFGPATAADAAAWSGLSVARLRPAIVALDAAGELWHGRDERGRDLLDLVGAPRPAAEVDAPVRLLPMWDNLLLAHADRTRVFDDATRALVIARNGDTLPTFLVDGRVGGLWWAVAEPGGRTRIELEPFGKLGGGERRALEREGERLAAFVAPHEPEVYRRYRTTRARRHPPR
jgi:hypothetical protein